VDLEARFRASPTITLIKVVPAKQEFRPSNRSLTMDVGCLHLLAFVCTMVE
jgi:hypothetical protein